MDRTQTALRALLDAIGATGIEISRTMDEIVKERIFDLAGRHGLSESYGALLHLVALMDSDGGPLVPSSEEEGTSWDGYWRGLISALLCVAMHEQQSAPAVAGMVVRALLDEARAILQRPAPGSGA